jgi:Ca2+-binding EF-hand superfamily protein
MNIKSLLVLILSSSLIGFTAQAKSEDAPEGNQGKRPSVKELFQRLDTDESGTLSAEEVKGPLAKNFDEIDADGDGQLTQKEMMVANKNRAKGEKGKEAKGEKAGKGGPEGKGPNLKEVDTDENGAISKEEATEAGMERLLEHFDDIDADGDGEITREEMKAMPKGKGKGPRGPEGDE